MRKSCLVLLIAFLFFSRSGAARELTPLEIPEDLDHTEFFLLTVGLGPGIEARYGHTMLRIVDSTRNFEENLNWGMFSFDAPNFALNFYLGRLWYGVASESYRKILYRYQQWEKRPLVSNQLNLTSRQKRLLLEGINGFFRDTGLTYRYQYFYNNCATIPRDLLNASLDGRLKTKAEAEGSGRTFRYYVYTYLNAPPVVAFFLDIVMNSRLDFEINLWQEMFYPLKLQEFLQSFSQYESEGAIVAGTPLLGPTQVLSPYEDAPSSSWHLFPWWCVVSLLLLVPYFLTQGCGSGEKIARKSAGLYLVLWGLFAGFVGALMLVSWGFSEHLDLHHNANLLLLWPFDFVYVYIGLRLFRGKSLVNSSRQRRWFKALAGLHLAAIMMACGLWASGVIVQDIHRVLCFLVPAMVLINLLPFLPRFSPLLPNNHFSSNST